MQVGEGETYHCSFLFNNLREVSATGDWQVVDAMNFQQTVASSSHLEGKLQSMDDRNDIFGISSKIQRQNANREPKGPYSSQQRSLSSKNGAFQHQVCFPSTKHDSKDPAFGLWNHTKL